MAFAATNTQAPLGAAAIYQVVDTIANLTNEVMVWNKTRVTRKILSRLSPEQLDDIGLTGTDLI